MHAFLIDGRRGHTDALAAALTISTFISSVSAKFPPGSARSLRGRSSSADRALGTLAHALAPVAVSEKPHLLLFLKETRPSDVSALDRASLVANQTSATVDRKQ